MWFHVIICYNWGLFIIYMNVYPSFATNNDGTYFYFLAHWTDNHTANRHTRSSWRITKHFSARWRFRCSHSCSRSCSSYNNNSCNISLCRNDKKPTGEKIFFQRIRWQWGGVGHHSFISIFFLYLIIAVVCRQQSTWCQLQ